MQAQAPVRERTNLRTALVVILLAAAGVTLLAVAANNDWVKAHATIQSVLRDVGSLLLASGAIRALAARRGARVRIALPDPGDNHVVENLALRFGEPIEEVRRKIISAVSDLQEIFRDAASHEVEFSRTM